MRCLSFLLRNAYLKIMTLTTTRLLGGVGMVLAVLAQANPGQAQTCSPPNYAGVSVRIMDPQPLLKTSSNLKQINSKAKAHGLLKRGNMVLGLTQSEIETSMNIRFGGYVQGNLTCLNIARIDANFGHRVHNIILPREYARGTCQYKTVLKHEMEHVRVNREGVRKYAQILKHELDRAVKKFNPYRAKSMEQGKKKAERAMQKVVASVTKRFNQEIHAQHAVIDKPGGPYDASGACRSW